MAEEVLDELEAKPDIGGVLRVPRLMTLQTKKLSGVGGGGRASLEATEEYGCRPPGLLQCPTHTGRFNI